MQKANAACGVSELAPGDAFRIHKSYIARQTPARDISDSDIRNRNTEAVWTEDGLVLAGSGRVSGRLSPKNYPIIFLNGTIAGLSAKILAPLGIGAVLQSVCVPGDILEKFARHPVLTVILHSQVRGRAGYRFDYTSPDITPIIEEVVTYIRDTGDRQNAEMNRNRDSETILALAKSELGEPYSATEKLQIGWAKKSVAEFDAVRDAIKENGGRIPSNRWEALSAGAPVSARIIRRICEGIFEEAVTAIHEIGSDAASLESIVNERTALSKFIGDNDAYESPSAEFFFAICAMLDACIYRSDLTGFGIRRVAIDLAKPSFERIPIDTEKLGDGCAAYWDNMKFSSSYATAREVPGDVSPSTSGEEAEGFKGTSALGHEEALALLKPLCGEAAANRKWTIPPGAFVQIRFGPYVGARIYERGPDAIFVWLTEAGRFNISSICIRDGGFLDMVARVGDRSDENAVRHAKSVINHCRLLMAAIVRDFWVAEEREKIFETKVVEGTRCNKITPATAPSIIYLPRFRYSNKIEIARLEAGLDYKARARHFVRGFLRRSETASPLQRYLAEKEQISIPDGHTYVRPHHRGDQAGESIYRSRSATRLLYAIDQSDTHVDVQKAPPGKPDTWFAFERDVAKMLGRLGYVTLQTSTRGRTDDGVDIMATKVQSGETVEWLVQCKFYKATVGISVVRELIGAIADATARYGDANSRVPRGMLVTTSSFSPDAEALAMRHGLQLIDGTRFSKICSSEEGRARSK